MSAVFDKECLFCDRPQFLWGGESCDVCDRDSNGINDRDEPASVPTTVDPNLLFPPEEKGFVIVAKRAPEKALPANFARLNPAQRSRVLGALRRKLEAGL